MIVVSDTSPLTALLQVDYGSLLPSLFGEVLIPPAVQAELLRYHETLPGYLQVRAIQNERGAEALCEELDRGEAQAIVLAEECRADYLLIDEKRGRATAESRGLNVIGLLGVLLVAKKAGQLPSVGQLIADLQSRAGFFVTDDVKQIVLNAAGEGS